MQPPSLGLPPPLSLPSPSCCASLLPLPLPLPSSSSSSSSAHSPSSLFPLPSSPFLAAVFRHSRIESTAGGRHTTVPPPKRRQTAPKEATTGPAAAHRSTCQQVGTQKGPAPTVFPPLRPLVSLPRFRGADSIRSLPASLDPFCRRPSSIRPPSTCVCRGALLHDATGALMPAKNKRRPLTNIRSQEWLRAAG